jgi:hypothetical protein
MPDGRLHGGCVELAIGLGAWSADRRTLAAIENTKLDAAGIRDPAHQTIQRIYLADEMTFAKTADGGIAGHGADGGKAMCYQGCGSAHPGSCTRGLAAGMPTTDHNDIE